MLRHDTRECLTMPGDCRRILVVAGEEKTRQRLMEALWLDGHVVSSVASALELDSQLWAAQNRIGGRPEVVVLAEPDFEQLDRIRAHACDTVVLIARADNLNARAAAVQVGAILLETPFDLDDLRTVVMNIDQPQQSGTLRTGSGVRAARSRDSFPSLA